MNNDMSTITQPNRGITLWGLGLILFGVAQIAYAPPPLPRVAFVVGIAKHQDSKLGVLRTTRNDAEDIAKSLANLGYQVTTQFDSELITLRSGFAAFADKLKSDSLKDALAVVYFAGYGIQKSGRNFLLPANFDAGNEAQNMDQSAIAVDKDIVEKIGGRSPGANVIILDACREDPFGERQGLAQIDNVPNGTLVELAAEPNNQSIEFEDAKAPERNGLFAKQLLNKLEKPNPDLDIRRFFDTVGNSVFEASIRAQKPRVMTAQTSPAMPEMVSMFKENTPSKASGEELKFWKQVEKSAELCAFEQHLKRFPNGEFADSARATINAIKSKIESAPRAFSGLPLNLKVQVTQSFENKQAESKAECERKWNAAGLDSAPSRTAQARRLWSMLSAKRVESPATPFRLDEPAAAASNALWRVADRPRALMPRPAATLLQAGYVDRSPWAARTHRSALMKVALEEGSGDEQSGSGSAQIEGDEEFRQDLRDAEQGEINSMYRIALVYEEGGHDVSANETEMIHWLVLSSSLGNGLASYKLYRFFAGQDTGYVQAVKFKSLAGKQGYYGPVKLSDRR